MRTLRQNPRAQRLDQAIARTGHLQFPASRLQGEHVGQPSGGDQASPGENRDAAAQGFRVAEHMRAEEDRPPFVAQAKDQRPHVAPAERIEPRHRLVQDDELGIVDQRLRDADALQHALREFSQLEAPLRADADLIEQAAGASRTLRAADAEQRREVRRATLRRSGDRRSTGFSGR